MSKFLNLRGHTFIWGKRTYIMGILNITPDSFSDGGKFNTIEKALDHTRKMILEGADIIDIGGQSTRPGSVEISLEEELNRVIPIIEAIRKESYIPISIDTTKAEVAKEAIEAGADVVNDISGGIFDDSMLSVIATLEVPIILMHLRGTPQTMQQFTYYEDVVMQVKESLEKRIETALEAGINKSNIIIDPGIGFAKNKEQNIEIIQRLEEFKKLEVPLLLGVSRKSFIGHILGRNDPKERIWGTAAACCSAIANQVDILRVHDVAQMYDICRVADEIWR